MKIPLETLFRVMLADSRAGERWLRFQIIFHPKMARRRLALQFHSMIYVRGKVAESLEISQQASRIP